MSYQEMVVAIAENLRDALVPPHKYESCEACRELSIAPCVHGADEDDDAPSTRWFM